MQLIVYFYCKLTNWQVFVDIWECTWYFPFATTFFPQRSSLTPAFLSFFLFCSFRREVSRWATSNVSVMNSFHEFNSTHDLNCSLSLPLLLPLCSKVSRWEKSAPRRHRDTSMTPIFLILLFTHSVTSESAIVSLKGNNERVSVLFTCQSSVLSFFLFFCSSLMFCCLTYVSPYFGSIPAPPVPSLQSIVHVSYIAFKHKHLALYSLIYSSFPLQPDLQVSSTIVEHICLPLLSIFQWTFADIRQCFGLHCCSSTVVFLSKPSFLFCTSLCQNVQLPLIV